MKSLVGVGGESQGRKIGGIDGDAQFLRQLAHQGGFRRFARLDLAAGEFPQARKAFAGRALRQKYATFRVSQGDGGDVDGFQG